MAMGWAIIGTGRVAQSMVKAIRLAHDAQVVAVLSRNQSTADAFAHAHDIKAAYHRLPDLLQDKDVAVVYVASPNALHADQVIAAAAAGKHVFCEKPMAPRAQDCAAMIAACRQHGVKLGLGFMYRQHPAHVKARQMIGAGELGDILLAKARIELVWEVEQPRWYFEPGMAGGGILLMAGVHRIDLLRYMLGCDMTEVAAFIGAHTPERPYEESALAMTRFSNGAQGLLNFNMDIPCGTTSLEIHGSRASLLLSDTTSLWWGGGGGELVLKSRSASANFTFDKTDLYRDEIDDFNRAIRNDALPAAGGIDGLRAAEICEALFESGRQGRVVTVPNYRPPRV